MTVYMPALNRCACGHDGWSHDKDKCRLCDCKEYTLSDPHRETAVRVHTV